MENDWAVVIGVNEYPGEKDLTLTGAVGDAISVAEWLTRNDGGSVPPQNLYLLTSPVQQRPDSLPAGIKCMARSSSNVTVQTWCNARRTKSAVLRYSGHGMNNNSGLSSRKHCTCPTSAT
jgi:hypothetical protein